MIAFLKGKVAWGEPDAVVIDVNGVGYRVNVTPACAAKLPAANDVVQIFTHMIVREDDMQLYGFMTREELNIFLLLLGVNGVGPRAALTLLSVLAPGDLARAVALENVSALTKAPGVGKKIAQRIILELKDKFKKLNFITQPAQQEEIFRPGNCADDALDALLTLGYGAGEARDAVRQAMGLGETDNVSELIKVALRFLDKSK